MSQTFKHFRTSLIEKTLTPAEKKKREEVAKAIERENPGMPMGMKMAIATKTAKRVAEEIEQIDELDKSTLASYAKKATKDARIQQSIGKDFEASANKSRKQSMKDAAQSLADKYKSKSRSREAGVGKAIDRLAKEEVELDEAKRIVSTHGDGVHTAKVYKDHEYNEYQVHFFKNGKHMGEGPVSYHDDKKDAQDTANSELKRMNSNQNEEVDLDEAKSLYTMSDDELSAEHKRVQDKINSAPAGKMITMNHPLSQRLRAIKLAKMIKKSKVVKEETEQEEDSEQHYCAKHVCSALLGDGVVLEAQHADPDENGQIEWYLVEFKDGIHRVFTEDLEIMLAEYHGNHKKKKKAE